ncbi:MAG TPA: ribonuclease HII [Patescibacteria group bacterium]|nr:ribonuclease HII [Patescibacteria group bacterium]
MRNALKYEKQLTGIVCGMDEVGRAPLAGPVTAACVHIPEQHRGKRFWSKVTDSKKLTLEEREALYDPIREHSCFGVAHATKDEIDTINIHHASLLAMRRACSEMIRAFSICPDHALVDGKFTPKELPCPATAIVGGDGKSLSIAAASIIAKVERDRLMKELHEEHPQYGWITNVGYPTKEHLQAIKIHGLTVHHRLTFSRIQGELNFSQAKPIEGD